jgi:LPPG:FO 2-phospho-L-lactate transferase
MLTVLAGGVGAARFLKGLTGVVDPEEIAAIVNVADDLEIAGLRVSPDLDTVTYTLAGLADTERGWGLAGETWNAMEMLGRLGGANWFALGDHDLGTHLYRTTRLLQGADLATVTREIAAALGVKTRLLPASCEPVRTKVKLALGPEVSFQEYFVKLSHAVPVEAVRFDGADRAHPAPGVIEAISEADLVIVAPSNPILSIGPILAIPAIDKAVKEARDRVIAVSPIVAGKALKGPADRLMRELGHESSVVGIARWYRQHARALVIDPADSRMAPEVEVEGLSCVIAPSVMSDEEAARRLARMTLEATGFLS